MAATLPLFVVSTDEPVRLFADAIRAAARSSYPGVDADVGASRFFGVARAAVPRHEFVDLPTLTGWKVRPPEDTSAGNDAVPDEVDRHGMPEDVRPSKPELVVYFTGNGSLLRFRPSRPLPPVPEGRVLVAERQIRIRLAAVPGMLHSEATQLYAAVGRNLEQLRQEARLFFECVSGATIIEEWKNLQMRDRQMVRARRSVAAQLPDGVMLAD